jgi:type III restriction enzyme
MQFRFDANQEYQVQAVEAVADLFEGQARVGLELGHLLTQSSALASVGNRLDLDDGALLANLRAIQERSGLPLDDTLRVLPGTTIPNVSVEMETGTGKTYVYLRTALELFRRYGMRKFIVVVPSVAIREGVLKTLKITERHFQEVFGNAPYRYYVYDSANLTRVRQFALSDSVEIMVMTLDSFNKDVNVIRQSSDRLQGETPIELVRATRPILILDEPQNMESERSLDALATLDPLIILRYSATHRNPYNLVYRLTPFDAYRNGLVKRIEVASVVKEHDANLPFMRVEDIRATKSAITARVSVQQLMKTGAVSEKVVTVKPGDSLEEKARRPEYAGFVIEEIDAGNGAIYFANRLSVRLGEAYGDDREVIFAEQIRYTVQAHFRKQERVREAGIKVLSLFFIDRVANYTAEDGVIRRLFDAAFNDLKRDYPAWRDRNPEAVRAAYFAQSRKRGGQVVLEDSATGTAQKDVEAYDLIMRNKERLLSFDEPAAFIFSHSALREGWDNPNVFQICTLNQTLSEMKKRQEIGRGVRLAVDQTGERNWDTRLNVLTVVANESYEKYVATLQSEIEAEYGPDGAPPKPADARKRDVARLQKERLLSPEFVALWDRIKHKTRYAVRVDSKKLIEKVVDELETKTIQPPRIRTRMGTVDVGQDDERDVFRARHAGERRGEFTADERPPLPNIIELISHQLEHTSLPIALTRRTLLTIYTTLSEGKQREAIANPREFATVAASSIKRHLTDELVEGIQYERIDDWYEMTRFEPAIESWQERLVMAENSIYDRVPCDSEVERQFVQGLETNNCVLCYVKLPGWFTVPTPVGEYNPDWALVWQDRDAHGSPDGKPVLYLVRETKSTHDLDALRPDESRKIKCGVKHFRDALEVDYAIATSATDIRGAGS